MTKIDCIIQARMGSTRLPGKVMMKVDKTNTILSHVINQLKNSKKINKIIIATTNLQEDDIIVNHAKILKTDLFRGNAVDVLDRYYQCAKEYSISIIVRIPSDKPLIDPEIVDKVIKYYFENEADAIKAKNRADKKIGIHQQNNEICEIPNQQVTHTQIKSSLVTILYLVSTIKNNVF